MTPQAPANNNAAPDVSAPSTAAVANDFVPAYAPACAPANKNAAESGGSVPSAADSDFVVSSPTPYADGRSVVKDLAWLKTLPRYLNFKMSTKPDGSLNKEPINPLTGWPAASDDSATWVDYATAKAAEKRGEGCIGFALGKEVGLVVVDFDKVRATKDDPWPQWALDEIQALDSYTEVSASGRGFHILVWGEIPENYNRAGNEIWDSEKMFALTGYIFEGRSVIQTRDVSKLHERIRDKKVRPEQIVGTKPSTTGLIVHATKPYVPMAERAAKLEKALAGDIGDYGDDRSAAVFGVLQLLARKHQGNREAMAEEFEASTLCADWGDKWDRLQENELNKAVAEWQKNGSPKWEDSTPTIVKQPETTELTFKFPAVPGKARDYVVLPKKKFDGWFARGRVHIVAGSSGAGKTTLLVDLLEKQSRREKFLSHDTAGLSFLIIFADRGTFANEETLDRMGLLDAKLPIAHIPVCWGVTAVKRILEAIEARNIPAAVFVEGVDALVEDANKTQIVAPFLSGLQKIAEHYHTAIILSLGAPKSKPKDQHTLKRDRVFGSQIWSRMTDTLINMSQLGDGTGIERDADVQHRNEATESFKLEFHEGRLRERKEEVEEVEPDALDLWMRSAGWFSRAQAVAAMKETGISRTTVYRRITEMAAKVAFETTRVGDVEMLHYGPAAEPFEAW